MSAAPASSLPLRCTLGVLPGAAGQPPGLHFSLHNGGSQAIELLVWGTPFEGKWFAPFVAVQRDGNALPYEGASVKRGEPQAAHYLRIEPGASRGTEFTLAPAFDVQPPGRYRVRPEIVLHDAFLAGTAQAPRPRALHVRQPLACNEVVFEVAR